MFAPSLQVGGKTEREASAWQGKHTLVGVTSSLESRDHREHQQLSTGQGSVTVPRQAKRNWENLQQPDRNTKVPNQEWFKKNWRNRISETGKFVAYRASLDFCARNNRLTHNTCIDVLYSTHMLQPPKCPPANTACLLEQNQGKGLVGNWKASGCQKQLWFLKIVQKLLYIKATQVNWRSLPQV